MTSTQQEIQKAIQTTDSIAAAGKFNPKQANTFLDHVFDLSVLKGNCRQERFRNERMELDELSLGRRVAMAHSEASDPQRRRSATHSKITIQPGEITVPIEISERYLAHNIEGAGAEDHIIKMMASQFANDQEELYLLGDTLGPAAVASEIFPGMSAGHIRDEYLALQDGWSKRAESGHILDAQNANISPTLFSQAMQQLPEKFQRDLPSMRFLMPTRLGTKYDEKVSQRLTAAGDRALAGGKAPQFGVARMDVPLWGMNPLVVEHVVLNGTTAVELANAPLHEIIGVHAETLGGVPTASYIETTDYVVDMAAGTIARTGGGAIGDGDTVKVTYRANPQMILTSIKNLILGVGLDIQILKGEEIFANVKQYVMHLRAGVQIQTPDAVVKVKNIGMG